jgi:hypothetical protein
LIVAQAAAQEGKPPGVRSIQPPTLAADGTQFIRLKFCPTKAGQPE